METIGLGATWACTVLTGIVAFLFITLGWDERKLVSLLFGILLALAAVGSGLHVVGVQP